jgi:HlyD family secretion protein
MSESIFRQSALDRLANPERLDASLHLVPRASWMLLGALGAVIAGALFWSVLTHVPLKVGAQGVLIGASGLSEIASGEAGRIERLMVSTGQQVRAGDPIAQLYRTDLERDLEEARAKLAGAQDRYARLSGFYAAQQARDGQADAMRVGSLADSRRALADRARYLEDKAVRMRQLVARGFVQKDRLADVQAELAAVREKMANLGESAVRVQVDANAKAGQADLAMLDERRIIEEQQRLIARLTTQLTERRFIRAGEAGQITELKLGNGDMVGAGSAIATLAPAGPRGGMVALLYVPVAEGKRIRPGMAADIVPANVERAVYGHITGRVLSVAPLPATAEGMRRMLRNDALVQQMMAGGAPIEVRVALDRDGTTPSGFHWSASRGPMAGISAGSALAGQVVIERQRVIGLLLPQAAD